MGKPKKPKVEITEYRMSMHLGICAGPVDKLLGVYIAEKSILQTYRGDPTVFAINKPELFGGSKKEGGVVGTLHFLPGKTDQVLSTFLAEKHDRTPATMTGYRGISSIMLTEYPSSEADLEGGSSFDTIGNAFDTEKNRGLRGFLWSTNSPYLRGVWAKATRIPQTWYPEKAIIPRDVGTDRSIYFLIDRSNSMSGSKFATVKAAINVGLDNIEDFITTFPDQRIDVGIRFYSSGSTAMERTSCDLSDIDDLRAFVAAVGTVTGGDVESAMEFAESWFLATVDELFSRRVLIFVTDTETEDNMEDAAAGPAADMIDRETGVFRTGAGTQVDIYAINYDTSETQWTGLIDNTPSDGIPIIDQSDQTGLENAILNALAPDDLAPDANPAHIIHECLTDTGFGMAAPSTMLDLDSFEAAADVLFDEGFGLSMLWTQQTSIESFISEVLDHIEATLYVNPANGLLTLKLIRFDYDVDELPILTDDNCHVRNFQRKQPGEMINEVVVTWSNPENEQDETVVFQDLANITIQGGVSSDSRNYYGVRSRALATKLALRDVRTGSAPLASCEIEVNREAWDFIPGGVVKLSYPEHGIAQIIMRIGGIDYGRPGDSTIKLSCVEDIWGLPTAQFIPPDDSIPPGADEEPRPIDFEFLFTLPYFMAANLIDSDLATAAAYPDVFVAVLAAQDSGDTNEFDLLGEETVAGVTSLENMGTLDIVRRGTLSSPVAQEIETTISLTSFSIIANGYGPAVGGFILFGETESTFEIGYITAISGSDLTIQRGCLDTVPKAWIATTPVWFMQDNIRIVENEARVALDSTTYKILPRTSLGMLEASDATLINLTLTERPYLPTRPADVKVNAVGFGTVDCEAVDPIPVTWANRNRLLEDSIVLAWDDADVTGEAGQTTTIEVLDLAYNVLTTHSGLTGTSFDVPHTSFSGNSIGIIRVKSERDGFVSHQFHDIIVLVAGGYGFGYGYDYGSS